MLTAAGQHTQTMYSSNKGHFQLLPRSPASGLALILVTIECPAPWWTWLSRTEAVTMYLLSLSRNTPSKESLWQSQHPLLPPPVVGVVMLLCPGPPDLQPTFYYFYLLSMNESGLQILVASIKTRLFAY